MKLPGRQLTCNLNAPLLRGLILDAQNIVVDLHLCDLFGVLTSVRTGFYFLLIYDVK